MTTDYHPRDIDKVPEARMAELLGTTKRALQAKRARKQIPEGVWLKIGRNIIYSLRRYDEWLESQWTCRKGGGFPKLHTHQVHLEWTPVQRNAPLSRHAKGDGGGFLA